MAPGDGDPFTRQEEGQHSSEKAGGVGNGAFACRGLGILTARYGHLHRCPAQVNRPTERDRVALPGAIQASLRFGHCLDREGPDLGLGLPPQLEWGKERELRCEEIVWLSDRTIPPVANLQHPVGSELESFLQRLLTAWAGERAYDLDGVLLPLDGKAARALRP